MEAAATPPGDPAPPVDPGGPSGPAQEPTGPTPDPGAPSQPPAETPPAQQPGTEAPQAPSAPAQSDAPASDAPAPTEGDQGAQAAQDGPLATSVHIESIRGTVILDGVGTCEVQFDFETDEGPACTVLLEGDPIDVDIEWPPDAPTHSSVQAGLTRAAQAAAQKASG